MQSNKRRDTRPELALRQSLYALGLRYRVDVAPSGAVRRKADIVFKGAKVAVFVDGCFWHGCPMHYTHPKTNAKFWEQKVKANKARDEDTDQRLRELGWTVVRVWEHEDSATMARMILNLVK